MNIKSAYKSSYIKSSDLNGQRQRVTISSVQMAMVGDGREEKNKPVMQFDEIDQALVLNKTNAMLLAASLGDDTDGWSGRQIWLLPDTTSFGGKTVPCIRVKIAADKPAAPTEPAAADSEMF